MVSKQQQKEKREEEEGERRKKEANWTLDVDVIITPYRCLLTQLTSRRNQP